MIQPLFFGKIHFHGYIFASDLMLRTQKIDGGILKFKVEMVRFRLKASDHASR